MQRSFVQRSIKMSFTVILIILFWKGSTPASESYELVDEWGSNGSGDGQFLEPYGLAIDKDGNIFVSDAYINNRIQKFTSEGVFITKWGNWGSENGEFISPWGIDTDSEGNVYVADMYNDRIQKFTSDGDFITKWSTEVEGVWLTSLPHGLTVSKDGNVYVNHVSITPPVVYGCIQKFTSEGILINQWIFTWVTSFELATDSEGNIYVPGSFFGPVQKFNPNGELIGGWSTCSIKEIFCTCSGIALDSEDNVYVSDFIHHNIKKFTSDGELITKWEPRSPGGFGTEPSPWGLAIDSEGYVYVADVSNSRIQKYAKVSYTTTTTKGLCPSEVALQGNSYQLQKLRDFRDRVLANTPRGNDYIAIYYQHSSEVSLLLLSDEGLRTKARKLLVDFLPTIESLLGDEEVVLSKELVTRIESLLDGIGSKASPQLRAEISKVQREIRKTEFLEQLGIAVID